MRSPRLSESPGLLAETGDALAVRQAKPEYEGFCSFPSRRGESLASPVCDYKLGRGFTSTAQENGAGRLGVTSSLGGYQEENFRFPVAVMLSCVATSARQQPDSGGRPL